MESRLDRLFASLREKGSTALMPFVCAGHPAPGSLNEVIPALEKAGASAVEIGFPFSDPIADGPVIAAAMHEALQNGITPQKIFEQVRTLRDSCRLALIAMVSVSIITRMGTENFMHRAAGAGFDGIIIPDLTVEQSAPFREAADKEGLSFVLLISPTTPDDRAVQIARSCTGFCYLLARTGITGERKEAPEIAERVAVIRQGCAIPIACGFGISTADHVQAVTRHADAAIVGSALVRRLAEAGENAPAAAYSYTAELCRGLYVRDEREETG